MRLFNALLLFIFLIGSSTAAAASELAGTNVDFGDGTTMELVLVPAGTFKMGSGESPQDTAAFFNTAYRSLFPPDLEKAFDAEWFENEHPQHEVSITRPFFMSACPVTRGQFRQFVAATGYKTEAETTENLRPPGWDAEGRAFRNGKQYSWRNTGFEQTDDHPVVNVSWKDANAFCEWLGTRDGRTYRLPTEAEWEYAYRAGSTTRYPSGDSPAPLGDVSNAVARASPAKVPDWKYMMPVDATTLFTVPVKRGNPNRFGLYDMHGNALQWCSDWYGSDYYAASAATDPAGPPAGKDKTLRGGPWTFRPLGARSAERSWAEPDGRNCAAGFRVVATHQSLAKDASQ